MSMAWFPTWLHPAPDSQIARMRRAGYKARWQALHLLWSLWLFMTPVFGAVDSHWILSVLLSYPVFLLLYLLVHVRPCRETDAYVAAMVLLAVVSVPINPTAWTYAVFGCVSVPYHGSWRASMLKIVFFQALMVLEAWLLGWPWFLWLMIVGVCSSAGFGALSGRINATKNAAEQRSSEEVRRLGALAERERIGRDLHDLLGHTLSLITLKLELSRKLFDRDHDRARQELEEAERVARKALAEVRAAVSGIRATDLAGELAAARLMLGTADVDLEYELPPEPLPASLEPVVALAVREAVTNIVRHARATRTRIQLEQDARQVSLIIADNGRGTANAAGNGLVGMRERIEALGGRLHIQSRRGEGTRLRITLPTPPAEVAEAAEEDFAGHAGGEIDAVPYVRPANGTPA